MRWTNSKFATRCHHCRAEVFRGERVLLTGRQVRCAPCGRGLEARTAVAEEVRRDAGKHERSVANVDQ